VEPDDAEPSPLLLESSELELPELEVLELAVVPVALPDSD
jgi:hypothetical protein